MRRVLYVCAPFASRTGEESHLTETAVRAAVGLGWAPIYAPWLLQRVLCDEAPGEREAALDCALSLLAKADAVLVVGARHTEGMKLELAAWTGCDSYVWPELPPA